MITSINIANSQNYRPKKIVQNNKEIAFEYNEEKKSLQFNYNQSNQYIEIVKEKEF
jgi:hypothetical protein